MSRARVLTTVGMSAAGTSGIVAAILDGSPWPALAVITMAVVIAAVVVVVGVVVLTAARTTSEVRHRHAHEVLRTLVFAARGEPPDPPAVGRLRLPR